MLVFTQLRKFSDTEYGVWNKNWWWAEISCDFDTWKEWYEKSHPLNHLKLTCPEDENIMFNFEVTGPLNLGMQMLLVNEYIVESEHLDDVSIPMDYKVYHLMREYQ